MTGPADPSSGRTTAGPFMAALVIVVVGVIGIWLVNAFSGDELTDEQQIGRAVVAQNDALQRRDYADFRAQTCAQQHPAESEFVADQRGSVERRGERFVDGATRIAVDGDRATAEVTYHFAQNPDAKETVEMAFVRQDGSWKVCSTGPE